MDARAARAVSLALFVSLAAFGAQAQTSGSFSTLGYNVAGLLEPFSGGNPAVNTPIISCLIRDFQIVQVQEDFNYHAALYDSCDDHPYRSPTSGGMGFGDGLNQLSDFPYSDWTRVEWDACDGVDCLRTGAARTSAGTSCPSAPRAARRAARGPRTRRPPCWRRGRRRR